VKRDTLRFGDINGEAIRLIALLGAQDRHLLRQIIYTVTKRAAPKKWSQNRHVLHIVDILADEGTWFSLDMESELIAHGIWVGSKRRGF
jgi:hypothetical protein